MKISPSILAADFLNLEKDIKTVSKAEYLHLDVMDGCFVPNITFGMPLIKEIRKITDQILDTHLMIQNPNKYVKEFAENGSDYITIHYEAVDNVVESLNLIKENNVKCGISIKPNTKVEEIEPYLSMVDLVLVMSVEPGFGGQKFIESSLDKIEYLYNYRKENNCHYLISVDGGINNETCKLVKEAGSDLAVCGSFLFKETDRNGLIIKLEE